MQLGAHALQIGHQAVRVGVFCLHAVAQITFRNRGQRMRRLLSLVAPVRCHLYALTYRYAPWVYGDGSVYGATLAYYAPGGVA